MTDISIYLTHQIFEEIFWKVLQTVLFLQKTKKKLSYNPQNYMPACPSDWYK
jgi:hypothetical protein